DVAIASPARRATSDDVEKYRAWWTWVKEQSTRVRGGEWAVRLQPPDHLATIMRTFEHMTESRRFFVTKNGRIGTGPATIEPGNENDTRVGDEIHVIPGSNLPLIL